MIDPLIDEDDGAATSLSPEDRAALIPSYIRLRSELNQAEQIGVDNATRWAFTRKRDVLSADFLCRLHKRMFTGIWKWAGQFRTTQTNIGIEAWRIPVDLRQLIDDVRYWIEHSSYDHDEIAIRLHHRLVSIHPFPNGNGRLSRLAADLLIVRLGGAPFTWGRGNLTDTTSLRRAYVDALQAADNQDIEPLIVFARS